MALHLIFWETTKACNLGCPHCRASAESARSLFELTTQEAESFIKDASSFSKPTLVFSGGEPLLRDDIYQLSGYAHASGLRPAIATNATLITEPVAQRLKASGVEVAAVSVYGATPETHDAFCGEQGAFNKTLKGIENIKNAGINLQINTTITKKNLGEIEKLAGFALFYAAGAYHIFFLVPTGRGRHLDGDQISPEEYELVFNRIYDLQANSPLHIKVTCAPHYYRLAHQRNQVQEKSSWDKDKGLHQVNKGCLAGESVCFISSEGEVFGCGYLPISAGNLRKQSFKEIWFESELFKTLRDDSNLEGKCEHCEFKKACGGCRARAYAATGDYLKEEPYCIYQPLTVRY